VDEPLRDVPDLTSEERPLRQVSDPKRRPSNDG